MAPAGRSAEPARELPRLSARGENHFGDGPGPPGTVTVRPFPLGHRPGVRG